MSLRELRRGDLKQLKQCQNRIRNRIINQFVSLKNLGAFMTFADPHGNLVGINTYPTSNNPNAVTNQAPSAGFIAGGVGAANPVQLSDYKIIRRNGAVVSFEPS